MTLQKFDFHADAERVHQELDEDLNANQTNLSAFRDRGGKLLLIHGTLDDDTLKHLYGLQ